MSGLQALLQPRSMKTPGSLVGGSVDDQRRVWHHVKVNDIRERRKSAAQNHPWTPWTPSQCWISTGPKVARLREDHIDPRPALRPSHTIALCVKITAPSIMQRNPGNGHALVWAAPMVLLLLLVSLESATHAQASKPCPARKSASSNLSAVCFLELVGKGRSTVGLERVRLNCNSTSGDKVPIGIPSEAPNNPLAWLSASLWQQLDQHSTGIAITKPDCQQQIEAPAVAEALVPMYGLLFFCEGNITFVSPVVRDLYLPYTQSSRGQEDTAPLVVGGTAHVSVFGAGVGLVDASTVFAVVQDAELSLEASAFNQLLGNPGSGVFARDRSLLRIHSSNFTNSHSSDFGGALAIMGCCNATVQNSLFLRCSSDFRGGAVYVDEQASLVLRNTSILNNTAGTDNVPSQGGGIYCKGQYLGLFDGTRIMYNKAHGSGGGVYAAAAIGTGALQLAVSPDTVLSWNQAVGSDKEGASVGGGAYLGFATAFDAAVVRSVAHNNSAARDNDIGSRPGNLTVFPEKVVGYVARPDELDGGLRVEVVLLGMGGFPCGGRNIRAFWDVAPESGGGGGNSSISEPRQPSVTAPPHLTVATNASGVAVMWLRFQEPPGQHPIVFRAEGVAYLQAKLLVEVRQCWKGEQQERPGVCGVCPAGSYNFGPGLCGNCPGNAQCAGGSAVLSKPGFWLSSLQHNVVHRWVLR